MPDLHIPDEAVPYILLQRTGLQRFNPRRYRLLRRLSLPYETTLLPVEARLRAAAIRSDYARSI